MNSKYISLVPAAGCGMRMGISVPKQYLRISGKPLLYHSVFPLIQNKLVEKVFVVLDPKDSYFSQNDWSAFGSKLKPLYCGGVSRGESVLHGLERIQAESMDWVLVHDAARPCLSNAALTSLIKEVGDDPIGGLLAEKITHTVKRSDDGARVTLTLDRDYLWNAQTPQLFRYGKLLNALKKHELSKITDESNIIERAGHRPILVESGAENIKVTKKEDLVLAQAILKDRKDSQ